MSWFDDFNNKFQDLFKREVPKDEMHVSAMFKHLNVDEFFNGLNNLWHPGELLRKIGGLKKLENLYKDPEIYAAVDKRTAALLDTRLTLEGGDNAFRKRMEENILPHERQLKLDAWWSVPYGYGVEQIIYNEDRSGNVVGFQREEFWRFEPQQDLIHVKLVETSSNAYRNKIMPYGKWVLTTNNGTFYNPMGEPMFERLIQPWIFRCTGWDLWIDFAKRFANGFLHAAITDPAKKEEMRQALEKSGKSSVLVTDKNTDVSMISASRDSSLYDMIDNKTIASMQKVVLGETLTNQVAESGSYGAASIHNDVRVEKTMADISLVEGFINEIIKQIAAVNGFTGELPKAKIQYDPGINKEQADRDTVLHGQGVRLKKEYYIKTYGLKEEDFEVVEQSSSPFGFTAQKKKTYLEPNEMKEYIGLSSDCPDCSRTIKLDANTTRKDNRQYEEKEEAVDFLLRNCPPPISTEDLIAAIKTSKNRKELDEKFDMLFTNRNTVFVDTLTNTLYYAASKGALLANPKKISSEGV